MDEKTLLERLAGGPASGARLARDAGVTRAAVWKQVQALRAAGVAIEAVPGRGYQLATPLDLLDADALLHGLSPTAREAVADLGVAWSIDSTNSELLRRPTPGAGASILLAERQTGGRGRLGRSWSSPLGANLYLSLARRFAGGLGRLPGLSLVAGVATASVLRDLGYRDVALKWPNDLVVAGPDGGLRKLGGLLVEGGGEAGAPARAVIGLGLNVSMPPGATLSIDQPWTDLATLGPAPPPRTALAAALLEAWLPALARFDAAGLAPFLDDYAALDALAGRDVLLDDARGRTPGRALGIAGDGALRVAVAGVEQRVHAGEVSVRPAGGEA